MITINIEDENNVDIQDDNIHVIKPDFDNFVEKVSANASETEISTIYNEEGNAYLEKREGTDSYRVDITKDGLVATKTTEQGSSTSRLATLDDIGDAENDVIEGYYYNGAFYRDAEHTNLITGQVGKIYIDLTENIQYRFDNNEYIPLTSATPIATMTEAGSSYQWEDENGFHIWLADPMDTEPIITENLDGSLSYEFKTVNYTETQNLDGSINYLIGGNE